MFRINPKLLGHQQAFVITRVLRLLKMQRVTLIPSGQKDLDMRSRITSVRGWVGIALVLHTWRREVRAHLQ